MEVYPLLSLVRGWEILTIPGPLVNRRLMVFSLKNQSLFNSATVRCLFYRTRVLNDHLQRSFARAILPDDRRELESATSPPGCEGDCTSKLSFVHGVPRKVPGEISRHLVTVTKFLDCRSAMQGKCTDYSSSVAD